MPIMFPTTIRIKKCRESYIAPQRTHTSPLTEGTQDASSSQVLFKVAFEFEILKKSQNLDMRNFLLKAIGQDAIVPFIQAGIDKPPVMNATLSAAASGYSLPTQGIASAYRLKKGQVISVYENGKRYIYSLDAESPAGTTARTLVMSTALRRPHGAGAVVEITKPYVQGKLEIDGQYLDMDESWHGTAGFTVRERGIR